MRSYTVKENNVQKFVRSIGKYRQTPFYFIIKYYLFQVDINKLAPKMNYESLNSEIDSDEENRPTDNFF